MNNVIKTLTDYKLLQLNYPTINTKIVYPQRPFIEFINKLDNKPLLGEVWFDNNPFTVSRPNAVLMGYRPLKSKSDFQVINLRVIDNWLIGDIEIFDSVNGNILNKLDINLYTVYPLIGGYSKHTPLVKHIEFELDDLPYFYALYKHVEYRELFDQPRIERLVNLK